MIEHELARCHMIHDQGHIPGPQHKPSQKSTPDEREQGKVAVPKQHKEYQKKYLQPKLVEGPIGNLTIDTPGELMQGQSWVTLLLIKQMEGRMILQIWLLSRMPRIMISPHLDRGCSFPLLIQLWFQNWGW